MMVGDRFSCDWTINTDLIMLKSCERLAEITLVTSLVLLKGRPADGPPLTWAEVLWKKTGMHSRCMVYSCIWLFLDSVPESAKKCKQHTWPLKVRAHPVAPSQHFYTNNLAVTITPTVPSACSLLPWLISETSSCTIPFCSPFILSLRSLYLFIHHSDTHINTHACTCIF